MIDLERLRIFIYAAENLSFSEAAKRLYLTQPTVSHHIAALEKSLNVALFERSGASVRLTEAGRMLLPWAQKLVRQANEVEDMMASFDVAIAGQLRIACSTTTGKYILPQLAARFRQRYANIQVSILACTPESVVPRLLEEEAHLAVVSSYDRCSGDLECQEFFRDAITLIVPRGHPWSLRDRIEPADLLEERIIVREPTSGTRRVVETELAKHDISEHDLDIFLELGNAEAIVRSVQAGYGVSFVSNLAADWAMSLGYVVSVPVAGLKLQRAIYMARRKLDSPHRPQEVFWDFVHSPSNEDLLRLPRTV
jgi:DNA-binding transcriptional LysR family regulator